MREIINLVYPYEEEKRGLEELRVCTSSSCVDVWEREREPARDGTDAGKRHVSREISHLQLLLRNLSLPSFTCKLLL